MKIYRAARKAVDNNNRTTRQLISHRDWQLLLLSPFPLHCDMFSKWERHRKDKLVPANKAVLVGAVCVLSTQFN